VLESLPGVVECIPVSKPYQISEPGREGRRQRLADSDAIGGRDCRRGQSGAGGRAVRSGSEEQVFAIAERV